MMRLERDLQEERRLREAGDQQMEMLKSELRKAEDSMASMMGRGRSIVGHVTEEVRSFFQGMYDLYVMYNYFSLVRHYLFPILSWPLERGFIIG